MKDKRAANPEKYREYNRRATRKYRERYPDTVAQNNISRRNYNKRITTDKWDDILNKLTKKGKTK